MRSGGADLLRWPVVGRFLRWRHARTVLQSVLLAVAAGMVVHGLTGPRFAPRNLATVLVWVHYRGLLVIALLAAGNLFCTGCPFVLVRDAARRLHAPTRRWPRALRGKWAAIALFAAFLFVYEWLDLWARPWATAMVVLAYFAAALAVDVAFAGASFCKHVCPIGQFNFVASTVSPLDLQVRDVALCRTGCATHDCIRGTRDRARPRQRGCELGLFLPSKVGTLDCTLCLDCVHACPHDNVALTARLPAAELWDDRRRSGVGRPTERRDLAALAVVFTFAALTNAFGMTSPVYATVGWLRGALGLQGEGVALAILFAAGLLVLPAVLLASCAALSTLLAPDGRGPLANAVRYAYALVPVGVGVWCAHYGFHLLTGALTVVPALQSALQDTFGRPVAGEPLWGLAGLSPSAVDPIATGLVLLGATLSMATVRRIASRDQASRPARAGAPWMALVAGLAAAALWILSQPMEMRGTFVP